MFLEISQNSQEDTCGTVSFSIKLQAEATAFDLSRVFSWRFRVFHHSHTKKKFFSKFHFVWNKKKKKKKEMKIPWWSSNIYFFARVSICLTSKILKEIWQMVIWTGNMFKENFMLQFSCLERNFPREKFLGGEHLTSSSAKMA